MRISEYFDQATARYPDREYLVHGDIRLTYQKCAQVVGQLSHAMRGDQRIRKGSHVAIYSQNQYLVPLLQFAINRCDNAWICVHDRNTPETNAQVLNYLDCEVMFFSKKHEASIQRIKSDLPRVHTWICMDGDSALGKSLQDWSRGKPTGPFEYSLLDPEATAFLLPTGGTTGPSKGVMQSHRSLEMEIVNQFVAFGMGEGTRVLTYAPLSHAAGQFALGCLPVGGTHVVIDGFDANEVLRLIEAERITHVFFPPTVLSVLLGHPRIRSTNISSLRCVLVGGAPVSPDKFKEAVQVIGPVMFEGYSQSEILMPLLVKSPRDYLRADDSFDETVIKSAGRAVPFMRVEIMDDYGNILPPCERGEIVVHGTMGMTGYYKMPDDTAEACKFGWHHTGDVGIMDERGYITIVDRKKDMIITGGFNVFPAEVEHALNEHPSVQECLVIGVPDEKWGEAVKALVTLKPGASTTEDELIVYCKERLGSVKSPKTVEFWPTLPTSAVGKLLRRKARERFWKGHWRNV